MKIPTKMILPACMLGLLSLPAAAEGLEAGAAVKLSLRGVPTEEQAKVNGEYRVSDSGMVRLPMLDAPLAARGLTPEQFARTAEKAYRDAGVYGIPAIEAEVVAAPDIHRGNLSQVTFGGQVRRPGAVPWMKGLTLLKGLQNAGDRNDFGGRNIKLHRNGKVIPLDFRKLEHKNLILEPDDTIHVEQVGPFEMDRG